MDYISHLESEIYDRNTLYEYRKVVLERAKGKVLDVGCGLGRMLELLSKIDGVKACGIDMNSELVSHCRKKGLDVKRGSILKIPFRNGEFDVVVCWNIFEHLERNEILTAPEEILRVTKKGGKIIIRAPAFDPGFWDTPDHTYPVSMAKVGRMFNNATSVEFVNYHIPKVRGLVLGKLNMEGVYGMLLGILPFRDKRMTTAIVTK
jgi:ubiquinone/menaquinone biosynthesis C-methylase UbiE